MVSTGSSNGAGSLPEETLKELRQITSRYPQARSALLPMLHLVQSVEGRVTSRGIEACADILGLSAAEVAGVATFYTMYKRRPVGDYHVGVCTNTLCAVMGGDAIFERLKDHLGVGNDETAWPEGEDGKAITLEHVECNAACDFAPVMMVNWEFMDNMTPESATQVVDDLRAGKEVHSTRGPRICTWREAERVLAGFPDDRADEGPAAGPASLVGLEIARENDWKAPGSDRKAVGSGRAEQGATKEEAADRADTNRAESETKIEQSPTDVEGAPRPDAGSSSETDGKGGSE
ncbi:MAG TPA: NADH-quinone oxidoreductase subunit NuoE [Nocardioidaceae bacterium]|nr:NADH-quinone oxidoreductase subunit NuoE [Nocardioidaceae bacterium]